MMIYCILHEEMVELDSNLEHEFVAYADEDSIEYEKHCFPFPFAYCPPPPSLFSEIDDLIFYDWSLWCVDNQTSADEVEISDLSSIELKLDFELEI